MTISVTLPSQTVSQSCRYEVNDRGLTSYLDLQLESDWLHVAWHINELGEVFPGGDWLVQNPVLFFERESGETMCLPLVSGEPSRATICGRTAFRRMRGTLMPSFPMSYAIGLEAGDYSLRFSAQLYDCRRLVQYCDAMQIFAGDFADVVRAFEDDARYWESKNHVEAGEPFRFPCEIELGSFHVGDGYNDAPFYHLINGAELPRIEWETPLALLHRNQSKSPLQPEYFFEQQLKSGIRFLRDNNFCRYGTHCQELPLPPGSVGTGLRPFSMWGHSFTSHYIVTGDEQSGAAGHYCAQMVNGFLENEPNTYQQHVLPLGIASMMLVRYARATNHPELLTPCAELWKRWPYDAERHNLATEPDQDGSDITANDTYNMKMVGACAMWLVGKYIGDHDLKNKGRDSVLHFVLPGLLPEGYWHYRPGSPEGEVINGVMANNHYDGFVKMLLSRLLMHREWRDEPGVLDALRRGMDFTLRELSEGDERVLRWELHRSAAYGPRETLARYLGHAGMFCEPLYALAQYCDASYLEPLQRSIQYAYDLRDEELFKDYWDNSWLYSIYSGLFTLSGLGVRFFGEPHNLKLQLGEAETILL